MVKRRFMVKLRKSIWKLLHLKEALYSIWVFSWPFTVSCENVLKQPPRSKDCWQYIPQNLTTKTSTTQDQQSSSTMQHHRKTNILKNANFSRNDSWVPGISKTVFHANKTGEEDSGKPQHNWLVMALWRGVNRKGTSLAIALNCSLDHNVLLRGCLRHWTLGGSWGAT